MARLMKKFPILKKKESGCPFDMAGIVPVAGSIFKGGLHLPVDPCLLPIGRHLNLIEHAVLECIGAGCSAVWIVCTNPMEPLLRSCVGEYYEAKNKTKKNIYYLPLNSEDVKTRNCSVGWSILYGATVINYIARMFACNIVPRRYYVSFPLAIHSISKARTIGKSFRNWGATHKNIILYSPEKVSVLEDAPVNFSFCRESLRWLQESYELYEKAGTPIYKLKDIFSPLDGKSAASQTTPFYYYIDSWNSYLEFCRSSAARHISKINYHPRMLDENDYRVVGDNND